MPSMRLLGANRPSAPRRSSRPRWKPITRRRRQPCRPPSRAQFRQPCQRPAAPPRRPDYLRFVRVDLFDFELPAERIALRPARPRDSARLLALTGARGIADHSVSDLPGLLRAGDILVFNDTRVIPAQLTGQRGNARIGATLHKRLDLRRWQAFIRNGKRLHPGDHIDFSADVSAIASELHDDGSWTLAFVGDE